MMPKNILTLAQFPIANSLFCIWAARLVLSLGAEPKLDFIPGAVEFALPFSTLDDACVSF